MRLHTLNNQTCSAQVSGVTVDRLCIRDACDPGQQAIQFFRENGPARQIAEPNLATKPEHSRKFARSDGLVGKRAKRAFANDRIERGIRDRHQFRVRALKAHTPAKALSGGLSVRLVHVLLAVVDSNHLTAKSLREKDRAYALARSNI